MGKWGALLIAGAFTGNLLGGRALAEAAGSYQGPLLSLTRHSGVAAENQVRTRCVIYRDHVRKEHGLGGALVSFETSKTRFGMEGISAKIREASRGELLKSAGPRPSPTSIYEAIYLRSDGSLTKLTLESDSLKNTSAAAAQLKRFLDSHCR